MSATACECLMGTARIMMFGQKIEERMCSGTLSWILRNGVGIPWEPFGPVFTSNNGTLLDWDGDKLVWTGTAT